MSKRIPRYITPAGQQGNKDCSIWRSLCYTNRKDFARTISQPRSTIVPHKQSPIVRQVRPNTRRKHDIGLPFRWQGRQNSYFVCRARQSGRAAPSFMSGWLNKVTGQRRTREANVEERSSGSSSCHIRINSTFDDCICSRRQRSPSRGSGEPHMTFRRHSSEWIYYGRLGAVMGDVRLWLRVAISAFPVNMFLLMGRRSPPYRMGASDGQMGSHHTHNSVNNMC